MLADPKYQRLTAAERSCWVTLLCLASMDDGVIRHCEEQYLITHSGIEPTSSEWSKTLGVLIKFEMLGMITIEGFAIRIKNWDKRQESYLTNAERQARFRANHPKNTASLPPRVTKVTSNRIEENRIDKKRINTATNVAPSPENAKNIEKIKASIREMVHKTRAR